MNRVCLITLLLLALFGSFSLPLLAGENVELHLVFGQGAVIDEGMGVDNTDAGRFSFAFVQGQGGVLLHDIEQVPGPVELINLHAEFAFDVTDSRTGKVKRVNFNVHFDTTIGQATPCSFCDPKDQGAFDVDANPMSGMVNVDGGPPARVLLQSDFTYVAGPSPGSYDLNFTFTSSELDGHTIFVELSGPQ